MRELPRTLSNRLFIPTLRRPVEEMLVQVEDTVLRTVGNAGFAQKTPAYSVSAFTLTQEIAQRPTWDETEIESRQQRLARLALPAWSI